MTPDAGTGPSKSAQSTPACEPETSTTNQSTEQLRQKSAVGRAANKFILHPVWSSLGAIVGVIGIVVSIIQLSGGSDLGYIPAELEVPILTIGMPEEIKGTVTYPDATGESIDLSASPVDITLKNNGDKPSLITQATAEVLFFSRLQDCRASVDGGARQGDLSAAYSIKLPTAESTSAVELGKSSTSMRFEVKPGAVDRMQLTLGPNRQAYQANYPQVIAARITLMHDESETLEVGTVAVATTGEAVQTQIEDADKPDCAAANLEILDKVYEIQSYRAPDLDRMRKRFQQLAHG